MHASRMLLVILAGTCGLVRADVVTRRWGPSAAPQPVRATASSEPSVTSARVDLLTGQQGRVLEFDLSDLPAGAKIYRADVILARSGPLLGSEDDAMVKVDVYPVSSSSAGQIVPSGRPLALRSPWFDRLDATDAVQQWAGGKRTGAVLVSACPKWSPEGTCLDVTYEGPAQNLPAAVKSLKAVHRAGLTFITWQELEEPFTSKLPTLDELKAALAKMEAARQVRYPLDYHSLPATGREGHPPSTVFRGPLSSSGPLEDHGCLIPCRGLQVRILSPTAAKGMWPEYYPTSRDVEVL